ncbi:hypothetical protein ALC60_10732 [Trachymyrmex zeteki]|uniref:Uncharacterized protein n=1 Tax=Mycetomoellerius zeteki TaxID=64791 RepID=A0A151WQT0_9HYME|nr:hypothetical protein ALC60_10732 [Trachymyrmex zeteki]
METAERTPGRTIDVGKPNESNRTRVFGKIERERRRGRGGREREKEREVRKERKERRIEAGREKTHVASQLLKNGRPRLITLKIFMYRHAVPETTLS